jgi:hypothetical protein
MLVQCSREENGENSKENGVLRREGTTEYVNGAREKPRLQWSLGFTVITNRVSFDKAITVQF